MTNLLLKTSNVTCEKRCLHSGSGQLCTCLISRSWICWWVDDKEVGAEKGDKIRKQGKRRSTWPGSAPKPPRPSPEPSPEPCWTWPGSAPNPPRPSPEPEPCWTWLRFAPRLPGTFSGTFSGTLLNLTWLCTKATQTFSGTFGTFSGTSLNLTWRLHQCTPELFWAEDPISLRCWGKTSIHLDLLKD